MSDIAAIFVRHHISSLKLGVHVDGSEVTPQDRDLISRRARTVEAFLIKAGVPSGIFEIQDFGPTRPLVPTPPGIPEPGNRFIDFHPKLHSSDEELVEKHDCEDWLRRHGSECGEMNAISNIPDACKITSRALRFWYLPD